MQNMGNSSNGLVEGMATGGPHVISPARAGRRLVPLLAWVAILGAAIGLLLLMGRGGLSTPSVLAPSVWPAWATGRDPLEIAFAVLRLVGLAAAWYLVGVTTIGVVARLFRWSRLVDAADILTVPSVRRLLQAALGLGLATAAVTGTTMGQMVAPESPGAVVAVRGSADPGEIIPIAVIGPGATEGMRPVSPPLSTQVPPSVAAQALPPLPTQVVPPPAVTAQAQAPPAVSAQVPQPVSAPAVPAQAQAQAQVSEGRGTYVVQHGDHLWGIAEEALAKAWGHPPTDAQVVPYWQHLIEANRATLVDPGNPDLILPGQTFTVPPPPPSP